MRLRELIETTIKQELPHLPDQSKNNPALKTFEEWYNIVNPSNKGHPSTAYDWTVADMNKYEEDYGNLYFTKKLNGREIKFFGKVKPNRYVKFNDKTNDPIRDDSGELVYYSKDEMKKSGRMPHSYQFTAVDAETDKRVGTAQDEWGALLISVAQEYRNFGIGPILGQLMRKYVPNYATGGVTQSGFTNLKRVHTEMVRQALASGSYSKWVKDGTLTLEKANQILKSANIESMSRARSDVSKTEKIDTRLHNDPKDWVIALINDSFIVYNARLLFCIPTDFSEISKLDQYWKDHMLDEYIVGMIYIGAGATDSSELNIWQFGGKTEGVKNILISLGLGLIQSQYSDGTVRVMDKISKYVDTGKVEVLNSRHPSEMLVKPIGYSDMLQKFMPAIRKEAQVRKSVDKYGEIMGIIQEHATSKFDDY